MSTVNSSLGIPMTQGQYAQQWTMDAEHISSCGHYNWMRDQIGEQSLVVEIGCGSGMSTLALAKKSKVLCVESNENLVDICKAYLVSNGVSVEVVEVGRLSEAKSQVVIIKHDLFDTSIDTEIAGLSPTAIVCWLIGAAPETIAKKLGKELVNFTGAEMPEYRADVHKRTYELGRKTLSSGGLVQIVDRIGIESWNEKTELRLSLSELHSELAGDEYFHTASGVFLRKAPQGFSRSQIQMLSQGQSSEVIPAIASIKSSLK
ncbi:hypothetical protein [Pseudomonas fluorescens]|uniref:hypothetical protein n=1 Tax=Pseudomonas TaxID=286 RepID=UPI003D0401DA